MLVFLNLLPYNKYSNILIVAALLTSIFSDKICSPGKNSSSLALSNDKLKY